MKDLEEELGVKLFTRSSYSINLTDEGMLLRRRAEDILDLVDKTMAEFQSLDDIDGGEIYVGAAESDGLKYFARAVKSLQETHPKIRCNIYSGNMEDVTQRLVQINPRLAFQTRIILDINKSERHIRGGMATKDRYLKRKCN